jgi:hypothetical protein
MKVGMTVLKKTQVSNHWIWLCTDSNQEWATYISVSPSETSTEYGHYFLTQSAAVTDFNKRVKQFSKHLLTV